MWWKSVSSFKQSIDQFGLQSTRSSIVKLSSPYSIRTRTGSTRPWHVHEGMHVNLSQFQSSISDLKWWKPSLKICMSEKFFNFQIMFSGQQRDSTSCNWIFSLFSNIERAISRKFVIDISQSTNLITVIKYHALLSSYLSKCQFRVRLKDNCWRLELNYLRKLLYTHMKLIWAKYDQ